jgi:2-oxoglutarate ferredoxin oxidoreductase subunit alpha
VVVHDASYPLTGEAQRTDITYYAVPFNELAKTHFSDGALRKYLLNMIYVGVLGELLGIDEATVEAAVGDQFKRKAKALATNVEAAKIGFSYAREHLTKRDRFALERMSGKTDGLMFLDGNRAAAFGCIQGGCTVAAWYPITPSSSLCENFIALADKFRVNPDTGEKRVAIVQAEDELAAIGMVIGAGWAGARAMTSTSGPGLSLMAEWLGYGYYAEVPAVVFDVQRAGPSTGLPTRTMQADVSFAYTISHGDTKHIVLLPGTVIEAYEMAMEAFDLADRFQTPIFVLSDLDLGMNPWMSGPLPYPQRPFDRGKVLAEKDLNKLESWGRYRDTDHDGIPYRTLPGTNHSLAGYFTRGTGHDEEARYSENPDVWKRNLDRLTRKHETARTLVPQPEIDDNHHPIGIIAYGTTHHAVVEARDVLRERGIETDYLRVRALPFSPDVAAFISRHDRVFVVEQNRDGQVYQLLRTELPDHLISRVQSIRHYNGVPIDAFAIVDPLVANEHEPARIAE